MEYPKFLALYYYLDRKQYPRDATESDKRRIRDQARRYKAYKGTIFRKTPVEGELGPELLHEGNIDELVSKIHAEAHFGYRNTLAKVQLQFTAPKLSSKVKEIVKTCRTCQLRRKKPHTRTTPAQPIPIPSQPFYMLGCDAVGPVQDITKKGNRYLLVAVDYLTRWPFAQAVPDINEETTVSFLSSIIKEIGVPNYLLTDRGSNFTSRYVNNFLKLLGCRHLTTTAYRPQTNGLCERMNQTLVQTIAKLAQDEDKVAEWDTFVDAALLAIRTMTNDATGFTPAYLLFGRELRTPTTWPAPRYDYVEGELANEVSRRAVAISKLCEDIREEARERSKRQQNKNKKRYDEQVKTRKRYAVGEQVLLKDQTPSSKFEARWLGPMTVTRVTDYGVYYLAGPDTRKIKYGVHSDQLLPYYQRKGMIPDIQVQQAKRQFQAWIQRTTGS